MTKRAKWSLGFLGGFLALLLAGWAVARFAISQFVRSDGFRTLVSRSTGQALKARAEFAPFRVSGATLSSDGVKAHGTEGGQFSFLQLDGLRADLSFGHLLEGVWQVDQLEVQDALLKLDGPRLPAAERAKTAPSTSEAKSTWWPSKVQAEQANFRRLQLQWEGGRVREVALEAKRQGSGWDLHGTGGQLEHTRWPALSVRDFRIRQRGELLLIDGAELLTASGSGSVNITGEIRPRESVELALKLERLPVEPLLAPSWKRRLSGNLSGNVDVKSPLPLAGVPDLSGHLALREGRLEALPVLDELALFTQLAQFKTLPLSRVEGDFQRRGERLEVTSLVAESAGLARIDGGFVIEGGTIRGDFQVGLTPSTLQWLPGARTKLFTAARDGYCWAPLHLEGPLESPREDLSARLLAAVAEGGLDTLRQTVEPTLRRATENLPPPARELGEKARKLFEGFLGK